MSVPVVTRAQWGAQFAIPGGRHVAPAARRWFVVHWPAGTAPADERQNVRNIENFHRRHQNWQAAPGYNFLVGRSGTIYEGCGRDVRGIHSPPRNTDGWGVCVLISLHEVPSQAALNATRGLYNWLNSLVPGHTLGMSWHGQHFATECPGARLRDWVRAGMPAAGAPAPGPSQPAPAPAPPGAAPVLSVDFFSVAHNSRHPDVRTWQARMRERGTDILVDQIFGPQSDRIARAFQRDRALVVDGKVGPRTWAATWGP